MVNNEHRDSNFREDRQTSSMSPDEERPLVSVVVVSYNYERFLRVAIESALAQTYERVEVVVVDDGSTDGSRGVIAQYADRTRVVLKANEGETSAENAGFAASLGKIVIFLDSDDMLCDTAVAEVVGAWRANAAKAQFDLAVIDADGNSRGYTTPGLGLDLSPEDIKRRVLLYGQYLTPPTSGNAYAREFLARVMPLDIRMFPFGPDAPLNAIAPLYGDVISINKPLGCYRIHGRNMWVTTGFDSDRLLDRIAHGAKQAAFLQCHAAMVGVKLFTRSPPDCSFFQLQLRLAGTKILPNHALIAPDRPLKLFWFACRYARLEERNAFRTGLKLAWFFLTAISPPRFARRIIDFRHNSNLFRLFVACFTKLNDHQKPSNSRFSKTDVV